SPDGQRIVSGGYDKMVRVWDAATGQETLTFHGHLDPVLSVAISPDGRRIVSGSGDKTVKVWDPTGQALHPLYVNRPVLSVAVSPDGRRIVTGSYDKTVQVWDTATHQELLTLQGADNVAFSPDGKRLVGVADQTVRVWDAAT